MSPPNQPIPTRDDEIRKIFWRAALIDRAPSALTPLLTVLTLGAIAVTNLVVAARFSTAAAALAAAIASATLLAATATLLQIAGNDSERRVLPRVALLTYGCVLRRLDSRYFPAPPAPAPRPTPPPCGRAARHAR